MDGCLTSGGISIKKNTLFTFTEHSLYIIETYLVNAEQFYCPCDYFAPIIQHHTDSARSFMKIHKLGHFNEEDMAKKKAELAARTEEQKAAADAISVGSRCKVEVAGQPSKLGTVMYVGEWKISPLLAWVKAFVLEL